MPTDDRAATHEAPEGSGVAGAPGSSSPGDPGYDGAMTVGDEAAVSESSDDPVGGQFPDEALDPPGRSPGMEPGVKEDPIGGEAPSG